MKEFSQLPARETFAEQLTKLKDEAARLQAKSKTAILTKTAQAEFADVQNLVDRYLDDEAFNAYRDTWTARARAGGCQVETCGRSLPVLPDRLPRPRTLPGSAPQPAFSAASPPIIPAGRRPLHRSPRLRSVPF